MTTPNQLPSESTNGDTLGTTAAETSSHKLGNGAELNFANFNQDYSCLSVGYSNGHRVYNCDPFGQCYGKDDGSIGMVEMLFTSSLLVLVGTGDQDSLSPRRLKVVNTKRQTTICELTFPDMILAVKLNRGRLIVMLEVTVYIYDINNMRLLHTVEIPANPDGLLALSASETHDYLAYPSPPRVSGSAENAAAAEAGSGAANNSQLRNGDVVVFNCKTLQPVSVIEAHKKPLAAIALSGDGTLLATASVKGTIVRVFSVEKGTKLYQFRRGTYPTRIFSLAFSTDNRFVVASSATETIHVFRLGEEEAANTRSAATTKKEQQILSDDEDDDELDDDAVDSDNASSNLDPLQSDLTQKKSTSSSDDASVGSAGLKMEPMVDSTRRTVARMLRRTSQTLGRKAAEKMGTYLPPKFSSILEPNRHFASFKVPAAKDTTTIVGIGKPIDDGLVAPDSIQENMDDQDLGSRNLVPVMVVTSDGVFYNYGLDPERGGDCVLLNQHSLLD